MGFILLHAGRGHSRCRSLMTVSSRIRLFLAGSRPTSKPSSCRVLGFEGVDMPSVCLLCLYKWPILPVLSALSLSLISAVQGEEGFITVHLGEIEPQNLARPFRKMRGDLQWLQMRSCGMRDVDGVSSQAEKGRAWKDVADAVRDSGRTIT